jgi:HlyD family secretion protein
MMKKEIISILLAASFLAAVSGCGKKDENPVSADAASVNVSVFNAETGPIEKSVSYTGEVKAFESVGVSAKVSAKAVSVAVKEGDRVSAGQVLATLDSKDIKLSYDQVLASYNSAVANYNMVVNSSTAQASAGARQKLESAQLAYDSARTAYDREKQLYEQNSAVKLAKQAYTDAAANYDRAKELYDRDTALIAAKNSLSSAQDALSRTEKLFDMGAATQLELDNAKKTVENAQANINSLEASKQGSIDSAYTAMVQAEENLKSTQINASAAVDAAKSSFENAEFSLKTAKENISLTETSNSESIKTAKAGVDSAKANLAIAENNLNNTKITAPISGYISSKKVSTGQMVVSGAEIFNIKNSSNIDCEIKVTESVIASVNQGTPATVSVKSAGVENISGSVTTVNPVKDEATGMYTVRVSIPNENNLLKIGMFVDVKLITDSAASAVIIPSEAIMQDQDSLYVYVADGDTAKKCIIETGIENDDKTEIVSGLSDGDRVIISGKDYLSEKNNKIKIISTENE